MSRTFSLLLSAALLTAAGFAQPTPALRGYTADASRAEREWEAKFRALPKPENMREYMKRLSAFPHHIGSPYDKDNAEWLLAQFRSWGLDAHIETFRVLFPTPKSRLLELIEPGHYTAKLAEPVVGVDPTSDQTAQQLPTYNAYSVDGDVTGPLVYVNYGVPDDYEELERNGISVKGAIVIARYGGSWRGIKPKVAAEHGAIGCIIYSDPKDDGYAQGDVFPEGAWRPEFGAQRGSVMDMPVYPGDPLTPGVGATAGAKRLAISEAQTLTKIPVLPISYGDAKPLLAALKGPVAPEAWRGSLPITYHMGPGPAKVHLALKFNWDMVDIRDVIATMPGSDARDEWIVRGNHHDGWVNGAEDPISGQMALLEEARAMAELRKQGWQPRRTIIFAAWDGEEEGLLGSTEWAEAHAAELKQHAAVYINSDGNGRGFLFAQGSHTLEHFMNGIAADVEDPETKLTVRDRLRLHRISEDKPEDRKELRTRPDLRIGALGSGSDYTVFIDHLGIPSLNVGFGGEDGGGIYHSIYDDFYWYTHFADTDFTYGRALAQTAGSAVMRLAGADVLPFQFADCRHHPQIRGRSEEALAAEARRDRRARQGTRRGCLCRHQRSEESAGAAETRTYSALSQLRAARNRQRHAHPQRRGIRESVQSCCQPARARAERKADAKRAPAHRFGRPAATPLVPARNLRPRLLHRLRRQDPARRARSHRTEAVGRSRPRNRASSEGAPRRSRATGFHDGAAEVG